MHSFHQVNEILRSVSASRYGAILLSIGLALVGARLFLAFSLREMDSFWIYSWATNWVDHGIRADVHLDPEDDAAALHVFHMLPTMVVAGMYRVFGHGFWTIYATNFVWLGLVFGALVAFLRVEFSQKWNEAIFFAAMICLMEPVLRGVISLRAEVISVVLTLLALLCARQKNLAWLAGLLSVMAFEAHATGLICGALVAARFYERKSPAQYWIYALYGGLAGSAAWVVLHPNLLSSGWLSDLINTRGANGRQSPFLTYFWQAQYKRHLPELVLMAFAIAFMLVTTGARDIWRKHREYVVQAFLAAVMLELLGRGNYLYVIWFFVPFYLLLLRVQPVALIVLLSFHLVSYVGVTIYNGDYTHARLFDAVRSLETPEMHVLGPWPAFPATLHSQQFTRLPGGGEIPAKYRNGTDRVLIVSRVPRTDMTIEKRVGIFAVGFLKREEP